MPPSQLPLSPAGTTQLNGSLAVASRDGQVTNFNGQIIVNGSTSPGDLRRAFGLATGQPLSLATATAVEQCFRPVSPQGPMSGE